MEFFVNSQIDDVLKKYNGEYTYIYDTGNFSNDYKFREVMRYEKAYIYELNGACHFILENDYGKIIFKDIVRIEISYKEYGDILTIIFEDFNKNVNILLDKNV